MMLIPSAMTVAPLTVPKSKKGILESKVTIPSQATVTKIAQNMKRLLMKKLLKVSLLGPSLLM